MKRSLIISLLTCCMILVAVAPAFAADTVSAKPTASTVLVDGRNIAFDAYNINGNNYFKLRDLAHTLSGSAKEFAIDWDGASNAISIISAKPYTPVGGEMKSKGTQAKTATPTSSKISLDGKEIKVAAYNIEGNNYFKLRDIGAALNFGVDWDAAKNTIVIDTGKGYTAEIIVNTPQWNQIIATINGENIYRYEYDYYLNTYFSDYFTNYYDELIRYQGVDLLDERSSLELLSDLEYYAWDSVIQSALIRQVAFREYGITLAPAYYEGLLLPDTVLALKTNRLYSMLAPFIEEEVKAAKEIGDKEAEEYYLQNPGVWNNRKVAHIIITAEQMIEEAREKGQEMDQVKAWEAAKKRAEEIIASLAKGEDFARLAAQYSADGTARFGGEMDLYFNIYGHGFNENSNFDPLFAEGAFLLQNIGDTSKVPVESSFGYHIIKLLDKKEGFAAVKEYIIDSMLYVDDEDLAEYFSNKMKKLQDSAVVVRNFEFKYYVEQQTP